MKQAIVADVRRHEVGCFALHVTTGTPWYEDDRIDVPIARWRLIALRDSINKALEEEA